jgi:hypothetical protein
MDPDIEQAGRDYETDLIEVKVLDAKARHYLARLNQVADPDTDDIDCDTDHETV